MYRDYYSVKELNHIEVVTMEYQGYHLRFEYITLNLYVIYHLPSSSVFQFCNEFSSILESDMLQLVDKPLYIADFNIHAEDADNNNTITFINTLESYNLRYRVTFPTHVKWHQLDLVIKDQPASMITHVERGFLLSDHFFVIQQSVYSSQSHQKWLCYLGISGPSIRRNLMRIWRLHSKQQNLLRTYKTYWQPTIQPYHPP